MTENKPLSKEDLLQERWKVINDYPNSPFEVGNILVKHPADNSYVFWGSSKGTLNPCTRYSLDKYPHLFSLLPWWEERSESELPEYIKYGKGAVYKVFGWNIEDGYALGEKGEDYPLWLQPHVTPSDETEYQQYLTSKQ